MILLDANVLLYAYDISSQHHLRCRDWLEEAFNGPETVGLPWQTILAFVRIATNPRIFSIPLDISEATAIVDEWLSSPRLLVVNPSEDYWRLLKAQLVDGQVTGPLVGDAALASLAIEQGARLCTTDRDFARFRGLKTVDPLI